MSNVAPPRSSRSKGSSSTSKRCDMAGPTLGDFWFDTAAFLAGFDGADATVAEQERLEDIETAKGEWDRKQDRRRKRKRAAVEAIEGDGEQAATAEMTSRMAIEPVGGTGRGGKRTRDVNVMEEHPVVSEPPTVEGTMDATLPTEPAKAHAPSTSILTPDNASADESIIFDEPDSILFDDPQPLDSAPLPASAQARSSPAITQPHPSPPPLQPNPSVSASTPQPLARAAPPFLPRHLSHSISTPNASAGPSLSYLTNVTTPGDDSSICISDFTPEPVVLRKKPKKSKSAEARQPEHIRRMLERKESLAAAREGGVAVMLEGKGKGKAKEKTHWDFAEHAERINAELRKGTAVGGMGTRGGGAARARLFDGCVFFLVWDMGKLVTTGHTKWLEKVSSLGAIISTTLDPSVTHVISLSKFKREEIFRKLGCQTLFDLVKGPQYVQQTWVEQSEKAKKMADEQEHQTFFELRTSPTFVGGGGGGGGEGQIDLTRDDPAPSLPPPPPFAHPPMQEKNKRTFQTSSPSFHIPGFGPQPTFALNAPSEHRDPSGLSSASTLREMDAMRPQAGSSRSSDARKRDELDEMMEGMLAGEVDEGGVSEDGGDQAGEEGVENEGAKERKMWSPIGAVQDLPPPPREREPSPIKAGAFRYLSAAEIDEMDTDEEEAYELSKAQLTSAKKSRREDLEARGGVFQCQRSNPGRKEGPNEHIANRFEQMGDLLKAQTNATQRDFFRSRSYAQIAGILRNHPVPITSAKQAVEIRGIGLKQANKIAEILETGTCTRLELELANPKTVCAQLFSGIYGIGVTRGNQLYDAGARTLDDLRADPGKYHLTPANQIGLKYYDDLQVRIPRDEVTALFNRVKDVVLAIDPEILLQPMGSYRRGAQDCGDIDILMTRETDDGKTHRGVLDKALRALRANGFLQHDLGNPKNAFDLEAKYMGICRLSPDLPMRRIDILTIPREEHGAALIYFTGNDIFNRSLRLLANKKGFSLNQRSLSKNVARHHLTKEKITDGEVVASRSEEEIFAALGVTWRRPEERIC